MVGIYKVHWDVKLKCYKHGLIVNIENIEQQTFSVLSERRNFFSSKKTILFVHSYIKRTQILIPYLNFADRALGFPSNSLESA